MGFEIEDLIVGKSLRCGEFYTAFIPHLCETSVHAVVKFQLYVSKSPFIKYLYSYVNSDQF